MNHRLEWKGKLLFVRYIGVAVFDDYMEVINLATGDDRFDGLKGIIQDYLKCTHIDLTDNESKLSFYVGRVSSAYNADLKMAYVANKQNVHKHLENLIVEKKEEVWERQLFTSMESALKWVKTEPVFDN